MSTTRKLIFVKSTIFFFLLAGLSITVIGQSKVLINGKVVDDRTDPIIGANVHLLNTNYTAITDADGNFTLKNVFQGNYIVKVTATGYAGINQQISIGTEMNNLHLVLNPSYKQLADITVTAQKNEQPQQQIPLSITTLSSKEVEEYRIWNIKDITGVSPNFYSADPGDKRNVTSVRGITTTSYDPAVATYVDGVNQFNLDTYISKLFDVDRIEVLRGPHGTLYGRNAMGGVVNIITKEPTNNLTGFAEVNFGNYGLQRYTTAIRTPLVKDKLFFGAAGLYEKLKGFYMNEFNNTHYDKQHTISGNYYLKYLPGEQWSFSLIIKNVNNRNNGAFPLVIGVEEAFRKPFILNQNATTKLIDDIFNATVSVNHTGRVINFNSQSSFQSNHRYYTNPIDADFSPLDAISISNDYGDEWNKVKVLTQEFTFSSPAAKINSFKWTAGAYFFHQNNPVKQATNFGEDAMMLGIQDTKFSLINTTKAQTVGFALFGQATYILNNKIDITAGLRHDYEHKEQGVLGEYQKYSDPNHVFSFRTDTSAKADFTALSPKIGLTFHPSDNKVIFVTYNRGFRAGGLTPLSSDPSQPPLFHFKPEYSSNIEAGSKNNFLNNRLLLNVTAFYSKITDVQVPTLVLPDAVTITRNKGKLTSKGVEMEINTAVLNGVEIAYIFGYTKARYDALKVAQSGAEIDLQGKHQIFTPEFTSFLAAQYNLSLSKKQNINFVIRGEWKFLGKQYFDLVNTIVQPSYNLFNTRLGLTAKKFSFMFWGRNMTDTKYISYGYEFGAVYLGDPRTYGLTISKRLD